MDVNQHYAFVKAGQLPMYTITFDPADHPGKYVVRMHLVPGGVTTLHEVRDTLDQARACVPPGLVCLPHQEGDNRVIVETWF